MFGTIRRPQDNWPLLITKNISLAVPVIETLKDDCRRVWIARGHPRTAKIPRDFFERNWNRFWNRELRGPGTVGGVGWKNSN
jgi:hypothetical protein